MKTFNLTIIIQSYCCKKTLNNTPLIKSFFSIKQWTKKEHKQQRLLKVVKICKQLTFYLYCYYFSSNYRTIQNQLHIKYEKSDSRKQSVKGSNVKNSTLPRIFLRSWIPLFYFSHANRPCLFLYIFSFCLLSLILSNHKFNPTQTTISIINKTLLFT